MRSAGLGDGDAGVGARYRARDWVHLHLARWLHLCDDESAGAFLRRGHGRKVLIWMADHDQPRRRAHGRLHDARPAAGEHGECASLRSAAKKLIAREPTALQGLQLAVDQPRLHVHPGPQARALHESSSARDLHRFVLSLSSRAHVADTIRRSSNRLDVLVVHPPGRRQAVAR